MLKIPPPVETHPNIHIHSGDLFEALPEEFIVAHVANDVRKWGAGFSGAINANLGTHAEDIYRTQEVTPGQCQFANIARRQYVANMIAQHGVRNKVNPTPIRYPWLGSCLVELEAFAHDMRLPVFMPKIGSGLAGGDWKVIERSIRRVFGASSVDVNIYCL